MGGEVPPDSTEIISSNGAAITIGGGAGAKEYDKITLTPDADGNVAIQEEFGTLDGVVIVCWTICLPKTVQQPVN